MGFLVGVLGIHYLIASLLSIGLSAAVNLALCELWVFRRAAAAMRARGRVHGSRAGRDRA